MNNWTGMGYIAAEPEIKWTQGTSSLCIANYRIAVRSRRKDADGTNKTNWIPVRAIGKAGEFADKYLHKGMRIAVSGSIETDSYEKDGVKHYPWYILASEQEFAEKKQDKQETTAEGFAANDKPNEWSDYNGELPFV